jgi:hypothetical protein
LLGIPTTNNTQGDNKTTVPTISPLDLNNPSLYTTEGSSSDTGDECKITSIYLDSKQPIYEIGDTIKGTIRSSCADKLKINKYTIQFLPEQGDKGITISSTDGKFEQRYDINIITILAKAGQSGKTKVKIVAVGNYENAKGEAKITAPKEIYITVDAGSTEGDTTPTGGKTIKIAVDKKEYNKLDDTIKLTIVSKPEGLVDCGYNLEADYQNTGKYGYKVEGIEIPNCTGSINIPVNKAYKIKLSVAGYIRKGNKTTTYESDPQFIELVYKPGAKIDTSKIKNDCYLDIVSMTPNTNKIYVTNQQTQDITVKFKLVCTDYSTIDVKPTKVSAYIDIHDLYNEGKKQSVVCQSQNMNAEVYKSGTEYTLSCSAKTLATLPNDARLKLLMVDMYYLTNQEDGFHHGEEYTARFISTRDKAVQIVTNENKGGDKGGGAEEKPSQEQQQEIIHLAVNPTIAYENQDLTFTITSDADFKVNQGNKAVCMIYWKNSNNQEGTVISDLDIVDLLAGGKFVGKKDSAEQT